MAKINPIQMQKFLKGMDYPVSKSDLVKYAREHGADKTAQSVLEELSDQTFDGPTAVSKAVGQIDRDEEGKK